MSSNDDLYKREADREWRESVDARLVNLVAAQKQTDDELDKIDKRLEDLDILLEGDPLKRDDSGLKGDVSENNKAINALRAIMAPDQLGHGGVKFRLDQLEESAGLKEKKIEQRWKFYTAISVAVVSLIGLMLTNLDRIEPYLKNLMPGKPVKAEVHPTKHGTPPHKAKHVPEPEPVTENPE